MDFSTIGSIRQYTKTAALKTQWDLKKKSGDVTSHTRSLNDFLSVSSSATRTQEDDDNEKLQSITNKVNAGAKLTEKEMEYLKEKNPQLYEKLRQIEKEQKEYEESLRHCKSKDEVQRLHMARVGESMQAAKNGDGTALYRMNRMTESMNAFTETGEYKKLSTEAEQALERKERREPEPMASDTEEQKTDESAAERNARKMETRAFATGTPKAVKPSESDVPERTGEQPAATPRFGTKTYVFQQEAETKEKKHRKAIDVDA